MENINRENELIIKKFEENSMNDMVGISNFIDYIYDLNLADTNNKCSICDDIDNNIYCIPCGHYSFCKKCENVKCYVCGCDIEICFNINIYNNFKKCRDKEVFNSIKNKILNRYLHKINDDLIKNIFYGIICEIKLFNNELNNYELKKYKKIDNKINNILRTISKEYDNNNKIVNIFYSYKKQSPDDVRLNVNIIKLFKDKNKSLQITNIKKNKFKIFRLIFVIGGNLFLNYLMKIISINFIKYKESYYEFR